MIAIGELLPNGARALAAVAIDQEDGRTRAVVLGHSPDSYQPYVTWTCDLEDNRSTAQGHYFHDFDSALIDLTDRVRNHY